MAKVQIEPGFSDSARVERGLPNIVGEPDRGDATEHHPGTPVSTSETPHIRLESAIAALPEVDDLRALREALVEASRAAGPARLATVDRRLTDLRVVEQRIPELAERVRERTARVMEHVIAALRAVQGRDEAEAARELVAAGEVEESHDRLDEAERYYERALELGRRPRDRGGEVLALRRLARVARTRGDLDRAMTSYRRSMEVAEDSRDVTGVVVGSLGAGHVLSDQGRWAEAREWYLRGMERVADRRSPEFVHLCTGLSVAERRLGDLEASEAWLERGEAETGAVADESAAAYLDHARAKLHLARGEAAEAEAVFDAALQRQLDPAARVAVLINLAEARLEGDRLRESAETARRAEAEAIAHGGLSYLPHVYLVLGEIAGRRNDPDGFLFFEQALGIVGERALPKAERAAVERGYGRFEAALGNGDSALARLRIAAGIYRSLGSAAEAEEVEREIGRIEAESEQWNEVEDEDR